MSLTVTVLSDGRTMDASFELVSVDVVREVNRIPYAELVLLDGDSAQQMFAGSNDSFFEPGKTIEIELRDETEGGQEATIFKGLIIRHGVEAGAQGSLLRLGLKDAAFRLTTRRKSAVYRDKSDDKLIGTILSNGKLKKGKIASTPITHKQMVQYGCTDWDFILLRAEALGLLVVVVDGEVSLAEVEIDKAATRTYEYGIDEIYDFELELDAGSQYSDVESIAWDVKKQEATKAAKSKRFAVPQGNLKAESAASAVGNDSYALASYVPLAPEELDAWSRAVLIKSRLAWIRGRMSVAGTPDLALTDVVELAGISDRFNGKALVTGIRHRVTLGGWRTDVQLGLSPRRFTEYADIGDAPAAGLLPPVNGLQIGVVDKFETDPDKELRVRVTLPGIDEKEPFVWARLASPDAGAERGYFFRPEPGDEVVVGFFNDDPRQAVVLGALFGSKTKVPKGIAEPDKDNVEKAIVTKRGTTIRFTDKEKASLSIETASRNTITLDDDKKQIEIKDQHGNTITMSEDGIVLKTSKDFKIDAGGNVEIKGAKVDLK